MVILDAALLRRNRNRGGHDVANAKRISIAGLSLAALALAGAGCTKPAAPAADQAALVARGAQLVTMGGSTIATRR